MHVDVPVDAVAVQVETVDHKVGREDDVLEAVELPAGIAHLAAGWQGGQGRRLGEGGWRKEEGGMEDGGWSMEDGGRRMEDGGWRMEDG